MNQNTLNNNGQEYVLKSSIPEPKPLGSECIIRTYSAGVHVGVITHREGQNVVLQDARRIWKWEGAFTLNAVATAGVKRENSRISVAVPVIELLDAIEIIPVIDGVDLSTTEV
jgi:hypothetical protein